MKNVIVVVLAAFLSSCTPGQVAIMGIAVNVFTTVGAMKQMYCEYLPGTQQIALSRIRKVDPDWTPICTKPITEATTSSPVLTNDGSSIPNDDIYLVAP